MSRQIKTTIPFRISLDEATLIRLGLLRLIIAHRQWREQGSSVIPPGQCISISIPGRKDVGEFSSECQSTVLHVVAVATNDFNSQSRRLQLDPIELAACILGVRVTEMMARHGHLEPRPANYKARCRRLVRKLERLRKRAKRAYVCVYGKRAFAEASHQWQQYVRFARSFFLFCSCNRTLLPDPSGRRRRKLIQDEWIQFFRQELPDRGLDVPPEAELRKLIQRSLRLSRRFIRRHGQSTVHNNPDLLHDRMVNYIVRRCQRKKSSAVKKKRNSTMRRNQHEKSKEVEQD
ncbi:MAG: hypothetical protein EPN47_16095 [Acidobacteria bacterium]|nr:MAG: hypothetical protein EPN47_16095 [Acidobacteriota bacterium]